MLSKKEAPFSPCQGENGCDKNGQLTHGVEIALRGIEYQRIGQLNCPVLFNWKPMAEDVSKFQEE